jgi:hypothetical protein
MKHNTDTLNPTVPPGPGPKYKSRKSIGGSKEDLSTSNLSLNRSSNSFEEHAPTPDPQTPKRCNLEIPLGGSLRVQAIPQRRSQRMNLHNIRSSNASSKREILENAQKRNGVYTDQNLGRLNATIDMKIGAQRLERIRSSIQGYNINLDNPLFKHDPDMEELEYAPRAGLRLPVLKRAGSFSITDYNQENAGFGIPVEKILRQRRSSIKPPKAIIKTLPLNNPGKF